MDGRGIEWERDRARGEGAEHEEDKERGIGLEGGRMREGLGVGGIG